MIPTNLLPASLYDRAIIAGGYAACPALADDMDVWVLRCEDPSWTREFIIDYWRRQSPLPNVLLVGAHNRVFEIEDETRTVPTYLNERVTINRVGRISGKKPIHVLVTDAEAPEQLIESFDISTHAIAIDTNGRIYTSIYWTSILEEPRVVHETPTTRQRLAKICRRYGLDNKFKGEPLGDIPF